MFITRQSWVVALFLLFPCCYYAHAAVLRASLRQEQNVSPKVFLHLTVTEFDQYTYSNLDKRADPGFWAETP